MTVQFKFANPKNSSIVEIDPESGEIMTSLTNASIQYRIYDEGVTLTVPNQDFEANDIKEFIGFLELVYDRFK